MPLRVTRLNPDLILVTLPTATDRHTRFNHCHMPYCSSRDSISFIACHRLSRDSILTSSLSHYTARDSILVTLPTARHVTETYCHVRRCSSRHVTRHGMPVTPGHTSRLTAGELGRKGPWALARGSGRWQSGILSSVQFSPQTVQTVSKRLNTGGGPTSPWGAGAEGHHLAQGVTIPPTTL